MARFLREVYPYFLAGKPVTITSPSFKIAVFNKSTNKVVSHVSRADSKVIKEGIRLASESEGSMRALTSYERKEILLTVASEIRRREDELAEALAIEVGKPIKDARGECSRAVDTFTIAAEESVRRSGEFTHLDISARNKGYTALTSRFPVGLVSMIVPFNFPLNLAAHKVAPAIAAGCPFVLKPSERTPITSSLLGEILASTKIPKSAFSILPANLEDAHLFSEDDQIKLVSFTGSVPVGWQIKQKAGKKKVTLELGGNAACVVEFDVKNLDVALDRLVFGAFYQSGQSCISVQRIYVHSKIYNEFKTKFIEKTSKLKKGDILDPNTFVGPLISENDAKRIELWVNEAVKGGGTVLIGGKRDGVYYEPTIVENAPRTCSLIVKEVFGPVCTLEKYDDFKEVCHRVNDSPFGLQAGIFTTNINKAYYAFENIHVGGVVIGDIPSARVDAQPYGGIKDSGFGREGIRYAIEDMTELKVMLMKDIDLLD